MFLLALLMSSAAYGAPSNADAIAALQARVWSDNAGQTLSLQQYAIEGAPDFPMDVRVARCERIEEGKGAIASDAALIGGQLCVIEVTPNLAAPYLATGAFVHDGLAWRYYGAISRTLVDNYDELVNDGASGRVKLKPGSLRYDGDRASRPNDGARSPYAPLLDHGPDRIDF